MTLDDLAPEAGGVALRVSSEELAYLTCALGEDAPPGYGSTGGPHPDAGPLRQALADRGILDLEDKGAPVVSATIAMMLAPLLSNDDIVRIDVSVPGDAASVTFFSTAGRLTRHEVDADGTHLLSVASPEVRRAHLARVTDHLADRAAGPAAAFAIDHALFAEETERALRGEPVRSPLRPPAIAGYLEAVADTRFAVTLTHQGRSADQIHATCLSLVDSHSQGLWLIDVGDADAGNEGVRIEQVSGAQARDRLEALLPEAAQPASADSGTT